MNQERLAQEVDAILGKIFYRGIVKEQGTIKNPLDVGESLFALKNSFKKDSQIVLLLASRILLARKGKSEGTK